VPKKKKLKKFTAISAVKAASRAGLGTPPKAKGCFLSILHPHRQQLPPSAARGNQKHGKKDKHKPNPPAI
jgi:hypothetical protein